MEHVTVVNGLLYDAKNDLITHRQVIVHITNDELGKSLSIRDNTTGVQYTIAMDRFMEWLNASNKN